MIGALLAMPTVRPACHGQISGEFYVFIYLFEGLSFDKPSNFAHKKKKNYVRDLVTYLVAWVLSA